MEQPIKEVEDEVVEEGVARFARVNRKSKKTGEPFKAVKFKVILEGVEYLSDLVFAKNDNNDDWI